MWPTFFPNNCPPSDAVTKKINVFRLVGNNPPIEDDFLSSYQQNPKRKYGRPNGEIPILAYGLSCFTDYHHAIEQGRILSKTPYYRKRSKLNLVASGHTEPECGVVKETPREFSSHVTYWLHQDASIVNHFKVI